MAKLKSHYVGTHIFQGMTMKEAKNNAECAIDIAFSGDYEPLVVGYRGHVLVVYRDPVADWNYRIVWKDELEREEVIFAGAFCHGDPIPRLEALARGMQHLAQTAWKPEDGVAVPEFITKGPFPVGSEIEKTVTGALKSWQRWQIRYRYFKAEGNDDGACHRMASDSRHETPFDLVK